MKVLYLSKASRVVAHRDKVAALARQVEVHTVVPERWGRAPLEDPDPSHPTVEALPARLHGHNHLHLYRGLGAVLDREAPELVHVDEEPYSLVTAQAARLCAARGLPFLFFAWQNLPKRIPWPFRSSRGYVFRRALGGIAGTEAAATVLRGWGFEGPLAVIPQMGVCPRRFRPDAGARRDRRLAAGLPGEAVTVGFVGRMVREKGILDLVDAVAGVPELHLLLVGGGADRAAVLERVRERGIEGRVRLVGPVASTEVPGWMAAMDVLALPSRTTATWMEQFGRVLVEAMACEVPVVVSDSGEMARVAGPAGRVFPEGEVEALGRILEELAGEPSLRRRLGRAGRERVVERYTHDGIAGRTRDFYRDLLAGGAA